MQSGQRIALAAGEQTAISVAVRSNTVVQLGIEPWHGYVNVPDTIASGQPVTIELNSESGPTLDAMLSEQGVFHYRIGVDGPDQQIPFTRGGSRVELMFAIPGVTADTAVYFQYVFALDSVALNSPSASFTVEIPETAAGDSLFSRPLRAVAAGVAERR